MTRAAGRFLSIQLYAALRTIVRSQARELPFEKLPMLRNALRHASWTTSPASVRLPVSQRANPYASSRCGSTTFLKRTWSSHGLTLSATVFCCGADGIVPLKVGRTVMEFTGGHAASTIANELGVCDDNHCNSMDCRFPFDELWVPVLS